MLKKPLLLLFLITSVLTLVSCGGSSNNTGSSSRSVPASIPGSVPGLVSNCNFNPTATYNSERALTFDENTVATCKFELPINLGIASANYSNLALNVTLSTATVDLFPADSIVLADDDSDVIGSMLSPTNATGDLITHLNLKLTPAANIFGGASIKLTTYDTVNNSTLGVLVYPIKVVEIGLVNGCDFDDTAIYNSRKALTFDENTSAVCNFQLPNRAVFSATNLSNFTVGITLLVDEPENLFLPGNITRTYDGSTAINSSISLNYDEIRITNTGAFINLTLTPVPNSFGSAAIKFTTYNSTDNSILGELIYPIKVIETVIGLVRHCDFNSTAHYDTQNAITFEENTSAECNFYLSNNTAIRSSTTSNLSVGITLSEATAGLFPAGSIVLANGSDAIGSLVPLIITTTNSTTNITTYSTMKNLNLTLTPIVNVVGNASIKFTTYDNRDNSILGVVAYPIRVIRTVYDAENRYEVRSLRIIPDYNNATLIWDNPDADIAHIKITYEIDGMDDTQDFVVIEDNLKTAANATDVRESITGLTNGVYYIFTVNLTLKGDDEEQEGMPVSIRTGIDLNYNNDHLVNFEDDDDDNDGVNDEQDRCSFLGSATNWKAGEGGALDVDMDGCRAGVQPIEDHNDNNPNEYAAMVVGLEVMPGDMKADLSWSNPDADITQISITYQRTDSDSIVDLPAITETNKVAANAAVQHRITGLTNGVEYTFTVNLTLGGAYAGQMTAVNSVTQLIDKDSDGDGTLDFNDNDNDNDGVEDVVDACDEPGGTSGWISTAMTDIDGDGCRDSDEDVDDDGDGLIEIRSADEFNQIRYNLLGNSFKSSDSDAGNTVGCGGNNDITRCNGYELMQNISLTDYTNWQPIGECTNDTNNPSVICKTGSTFFNSIFDGNDYEISGLTITADGSFGKAAGLFATMSSSAELRNIHISSASVNYNGYTGLLVGYANGGIITDSSVTGQVTSTSKRIGGLVGYMEDAAIMSSQVTITGAINGDANVGGLVGYTINGRIMDSFTTGTITGTGNNVGGLVGYSSVSIISGSYTTNGTVMGSTGSFDVGGLVGELDMGSIINSSYAEGGSVSGRTNVGGLVGNSPLNSRVITSYAMGQIISGTGSVIGGLVGNLRSSYISASYARGGTVSGGSNVGGLVGSGSKRNDAVAPTISSSYAAVGTLSGTNLGGLVGGTNLATIVFNVISYWDTSTTGTSAGSVTNKAEGRSTAILHAPTSFDTGLYASWREDKCDDGSRAWHLGTSSQYPVLTCTPGGVDAQR